MGPTRSIGRRNFLRVGMASGALLAFPAVRAAAPAVSLKYAHNAPMDHPIHIHALAAVGRIREQSAGRIDIRIFPNNQLGSDTDLLSQVRAGAIDMLSMPSQILATITPAAAISGVGFAFKDYAAVWEAMDGGLGAYVRTNIEKAGLISFDKIWDNGFRQATTSTKPIRDAADLAGMKIRVPVSPLQVSLFKALGASPVTINYNELYSSLQTKVVDGQENALVLLPFAKFYEVQKYCSLTNHMWDGFWQLANRKVFAKLPEDARDIIRRNWNLAAEGQRVDMARLNSEAQALLEGKGMVFNSTETTSFRGLLKKSSFYEDWRKRFGEEAWAQLEKYSGPLA